MRSRPFAFVSTPVAVVLLACAASLQSAAAPVPRGRAAAPLERTADFEGRWGHAVARLGNTLVLFGGSAGGPATAGTRVWDGANWTTLDLPVEPEPRSDHAMATLGGRVVLFGGRGTHGVLSDTWLFDGSRWTRADAPGPSARAGHAMASLGDRVVLFGGKGNNGYLAETWEWDGARWASRSGGAAPPGREGHAMAALGARLLLFGGMQVSGAGVEALGDVWQWDGAQWQQEASAPAPPPRFGHVLLPVPRGLLLFGGTRSGSALAASTWEWNGQTWSELQPPTTPAGRYEVAGAGTACGALVVGGTEGAGRGARGDTWEWDGWSWRLVDGGEQSVLTLAGEGASVARAAAPAGQPDPYLPCARDRGTVEAFIWLPRFPAVSSARFFVARVTTAAWLLVRDRSATEVELVCLRRLGQALNKYEGRAVRLAKREVEGRWHHVACTWDALAGTAGLFLDGARQTEGGQDESVLSPPAWEGTSVFAGFESGPNRGKLMRIDELRLSREIRYPSPEPVLFGTRFEPDAATCGLWHFDEGPGAGSFQDAVAAQVGRRLNATAGASTSKEAGVATPYGACTR